MLCIYFNAYVIRITTVNSCNSQITGRKNCNKRVCQFYEQNSNPQSYTAVSWTFQWTDSTHKPWFLVTSFNLTWENLNLHFIHGNSIEDDIWAPSKTTWQAGWTHDRSTRNCLQFKSKINRLLTFKNNGHVVVSLKYPILKWLIWLEEYFLIENLFKMSVIVFCVQSKFLCASFTDDLRFSFTVERTRHKKWSRLLITPDQPLWIQLKSR